jgi:hypothetical protein
MLHQCYKQPFLTRPFIFLQDMMSEQFYYFSSEVENLDLPVARDVNRRVPDEVDNKSAGGDLKRKRGRPPKPINDGDSCDQNLQDGDLDTVDHTLEESVPLKRKRGRPPKPINDDDSCDQNLQAGDLDTVDHTFADTDRAPDEVYSGGREGRRSSDKKRRAYSSTKEVGERCYAMYGGNEQYYWGKLSSETCTAEFVRCHTHDCSSFRQDY